ncbi:helix-turn-helix transcriptional regulator [Yinghuangia soli]|uniref:MarR family transcriptional regulator n=1 Tax=Yinghuangia soli TaxID=2908204 RepID=A0AA41PWV0_9ACTN|nr:helix-turn-helix domain-containing protein [Yinghuangia soli]MCF2527193.1 MarR family transcriptional regulator [Yinghuangia soli]
MTESGGREWTFLTSHARVLVHVARNPQARIRDIADACLLSIRAVQLILDDLEEAGYLTRQRTGRHNTYRVTPGTHMRRAADGPRTVALVLDLPEQTDH